MVMEEISDQLTCMRVIQGTGRQRLCNLSIMPGCAFLWRSCLWITFAHTINFSHIIWLVTLINALGHTLNTYTTQNILHGRSDKGRITQGKIHCRSSGGKIKKNEGRCWSGWLQAARMTKPEWQRSLTLPLMKSTVTLMTEASISVTDRNQGRVRWNLDGGAWSRGSLERAICQRVQLVEKRRKI